MIKRREFIERIIVAGGIAAFQPWELVKLLGVSNIHQMGQVIEDWDVIAEAKNIPKNNIEFGNKLVDSNQDQIVFQRVWFGDAVWSVEEETDKQFIYPSDDSLRSYKISIISPGSIGSAYDIEFAVNTTLVQAARLLLPVYPVLTGPSFTVIVSIGQESDLSNRFEYRFVYLNNKGWYDNIRLVDEPTAIVGSPAITNTFTRVRIRVDVSAGVTGSVYIGSLYVNPKSVTRIAIGFDDRRLTEYENAYSYMYTRRIPGYTSVVSSYNTPIHLTVNQIQTMAENGWSIHNHTDKHLSAFTLTLDQFTDEVEKCISFLKGIGVYVTGSSVFVYPFHIGNADTDLIVQRHYPYWTRSNGTTSGIWGFSGIIRDPANSMIMLPRINIDNPITPESVISNINRLIKQGVDGILYGHNPVENAPNGNTEVSSLKTIVDVLHRYKQAGLIRVVNMNDIVVGLQRARLLRFPVGG